MTTGRMVRLGRPFSIKHLEDIERGASTREDIRNWFGEPFSTAFSEKVDSQGRRKQETWVYTYAEGELGSTTAQSLTVVFDPAGIVQASSYTGK